MPGKGKEGEKVTPDKNLRLTGGYEEHAENVGKCVFCDLKDKYIVIQNESGVLTVNTFPYINGQLLVVPYRHVERFEDLDESERLGHLSLIDKGQRLLADILNVHNTWTILRNGDNSGKTVKHLHWNILPYIDGLNTWHYQEITIPPEDLAKILRR